MHDSLSGLSDADDLTESFTRYQDDVDFIHGFSLAQAAAGRDVRRVVSSTAILLLHPLCLSTERVPAAVHWLERNGFTVYYCQQVQLDNDNLRRIWKYQIAAHDSHRIRIMSQLLTHGPSVLIGIVDPCGSAPAATRLRSLKGPADPHRAGPQHLRSHLGAANMFNNLAHTPDGPAELLRESAAILDEPGLARLWYQAAAALQCSSVAASRPTLPDPPFTAPHGGISLAHVAVRLRRSLLTHLRLVLPVSADPLAASLEAMLAAEAAWVADHDPTKPVETLAGFRRFFQPSSAPLLDAVKSGGSLRGCALASAFAETERALFGDSFDLGQVEAAASEGGLPLGIRDRIVLAAEWLSLRYRQP